MLLGVCKASEIAPSDEVSDSTMKIKTILCTSLALGFRLACADAPDSGYHGMSGPNGGRLLVEVEPHIEFLVQMESKKVEIRFIGDALIVLEPGSQEVNVSIGEGANVAKLTFIRDGEKFVSESALPAGEKQPVTVQLRTTPGAPLITAEKFILDLSPCLTGRHLRYNCTCEGGGQVKSKSPK